MTPYDRYQAREVGKDAGWGGMMAVPAGNEVGEEQTEAAQGPEPRPRPRPGGDASSSPPPHGTSARGAASSHVASVCAEVCTRAGASALALLSGGVGGPLRPNVWMSRRPRCPLWQEHSPNYPRWEWGPLRGPTGLDVPHAGL